MQKPTTILLCRNPSKTSKDVEKFASTLTLEEAIEVLKTAEARKAEGHSICTNASSEQVISDLKMHRFEEGGH